LRVKASTSAASLGCQLRAARHHVVEDLNLDMESLETTPRVNAALTECATIVMWQRSDIVG
jgi:hypothetical protein